MNLLLLNMLSCIAAILSHLTTAQTLPKCYNDIKLPSSSLLSSSFSSSDKYSWQSTTTNSEQNSLFLGGYTASLSNFAFKSTAVPQIRNLPLAGRFSLTTQSYVWVKTYIDAENKTG